MLKNTAIKYQLLEKIAMSHFTDVFVCVPNLIFQIPLKHDHIIHKKNLEWQNVGM